MISQSSIEVESVTLQICAICVQLDALKAYPNVLVLTTSNITEAIDLAFVDRADIKAYVGPPGEQVGALGHHSLHVLLAHLATSFSVWSKSDIYRVVKVTTKSDCYS